MVFNRKLCYISLMNKNNVIEITPDHKKAGGIVNALSSTLRRLTSFVGFGISPDGKRNYNDLYGYGDVLSYADYYSMYRRSGFGNVVVGKVAKACWKEIPKIMQGDNQILEEEMDILSNAGFFRKLERADMLNRIGQFSVLLIGMPDGMDLDQPVGSANDITGLYFNPYNMDGIEILKWDTDPTSPRYDLPEMYQVQTTSHGEKFKTVQRRAIKVHYSRIVHLAEGALDSSIEGMSSLEACFNTLTDVNKVRGGSGEAYFRNARQQRALEADKDAQIDSNSPGMATLKDNVDAFDNGWETTLRLQNMKVNQLNPSLVSPRDTFDISVEELSGQTGIPIRILTGKGAGNMAGVEDRASWNALIEDRRSSECDAYLLDSLKIMAEAGLFELPDDATVEWPPQSAMSEKEASEAKKRKSETLEKVISALNTPVGDELDAESVFKAFDLDDIEADYSAIDDIETDTAADEAAKVALAKLSGQPIQGIGDDLNQPNPDKGNRKGLDKGNKPPVSSV